MIRTSYDYCVTVRLCAARVCVLRTRQSVHAHCGTVEKMHTEYSNT